MKLYAKIIPIIVLAALVGGSTRASTLVAEAITVQEPIVAPAPTSTPAVAVKKAVAVVPKPEVAFVPVLTPVVGTEINASNIVALINNDRASSSLPMLVLDEKLTAAAQAKATDEVVRQYFSHTDPDGAYVWPTITEAGYKYLRAGENLAVAFTQVQAEELAWMTSPKHRDNILNTHYESIGIGIATGTYNGHSGVVYVVTLFAQKQ